MDFQIDRSDMSTARVVESAVAPLAEGETRLAVQAFAVTSNTITYGVVGDRFGYWDAFPVRPTDPGDGERGWGRLPAWGVAEVVESRSELVPLGMRVHGLVPMSSEVVLVPGKVGPSGFSDVANHRGGLAPLYNRYRTLAVTEEPLPTIDEMRRMVHEPLFVTSLLIDDLLSGYPALDHVVLSSASSKTAIGTAHLVRARGGPGLVGLTSPGHRTFVENLGLYDRVLTYDGLEGLPTGTAAYVDIAGSAPTRAGVHGHYLDRLRLSLLVGQTHRDQGSEASGQRLPGPRPTVFFAPSHLAERSVAVGRAPFDAEVAAAWEAYVEVVDDWIRYEHAVGVSALEAAYRALLDNRADPCVATTRAL